MDHDITRTVATHLVHANDGVLDAAGPAFLEIEHFDQWTVPADAPTFSRMCATMINTEAVGF